MRTVTNIPCCLLYTSFSDYGEDGDENISRQTEEKLEGDNIYNDQMPEFKADNNIKFVFNAVPTTDWGSPETLEHWRQTWAELCNAKFAEKGLDVRIDHRSYERQGVEILPTVHEGATVRAMEKKGIRTEKGERSEERRVGKECRL